MSKTPEEFLNEIRDMDKAVWNTIERANKMKQTLEKLKGAKHT